MAKNKIDIEEDDSDDFEDEDLGEEEEDEKPKTKKPKSNYGILSERISKLEKSDELHKKYIKKLYESFKDFFSHLNLHQERIKELQDNFRLLIEK